MIKKLSLFSLQEKTIADKLRKSGINKATLETEPTIYFCINRFDSTDYYITLNQATNRTNYYMDFVDIDMFNDSMEVEDIVYYILNGLHERYYLSNKIFEQFKRESIKVEATNKYLTINNQILKNEKEISVITIEKLKAEKEIYKKLENLENEKLKRQVKILQNEKKSHKLQLMKLQSKLIQIQSIAL